MDDTEVKLRLTANDDASPKVLALLDNVRRLRSEMSGLGKASPAVTRAMSAFGGGTVDKVRAVTRAVEELTAAQDRQAASAGRVGMAQATIAQLRRGGTGSRAMRGVARDQERVEQAVFRAWRVREGIRRSTTLAEDRARERAESAVFKRYKIGAAIKRATLAGEERQRRDADRAAERDARAAHSLFQNHARLKLRSWKMGEVERIRGERAEQRAADRRQAGSRRNVRAGLGQLAATPGRLARSADAFMPPVVMSAVTGGGIVAAVRGLLRSEASADDAEVNMRIAGGLSADDARKMRNGWAAPTALQLGMTAPEAMRGWTEATKVGIPDNVAKDFVELSQKVSAALEIPIDRVNDVLGIVNAQQGGKGDIKALSGVTNAMSYLADKMATTPDKLISFMQRGAGAASVLGMHQDAGLAFGAAATSLGIQAGSAGRMFDFIAGRTINLPNLVKKHGAEGDQARQTVRDLGYGNVKNMDRIRRADPDSFVFDLMERFSKIKDPRKRERDMRFFSGQEWFGELSSMVGRVDTVKQARDLAIQARSLDALGRRWELHKGKLSFLWKQMTAGTQNVLGSLGEEIAPLAREAGDFYLKWTADISNGNLHTAFRRGLDGIVEGLLGKPGTLSNLMTGVFGVQGMRGQFDPTQFFAAARGFASGLRATYDVVSSAFSGMAGLLGFDTGSVESMVKFTGEFLAFGVALQLAKPVIGVLGALTAVISTLTTGGSAVGALLAGGALLPVTIAAVGVGAIAVTVMNWDKITSAWDDTVAHLKGIITGKPVERTQRDRAIQGVEGKRAETLPDAQRLMPDQLGPSGFLPMSYREPERKNWRDLLTPAAFHGGDLGASWRASEPLENLSRDMRALRSTIEGNGVTGLRGGSALASLGNLRGGGIGGSFTQAGPGGNQPTGAVNSFGLGPRGIMGGGGYGSDAGGTAGSLKGGVKERANRAMAKLMGMGWSREAAAAAIGNAQQESGVRSDGPLGDTKRFGFGDDAAHGMFQWRGQRFRDLKAYAQGKGTNWQDFDTQVEFFDKESAKYGSANWKKGDLRTANIGMKRFEGYGDNSQAQRYANGAQLLRDGSGTNPVGGPPTPGLGMIPVKTGNGFVMMDPAKGYGQAFGGGNTSAGVTSLAKQMGQVPGGLKGFTSFDDNFHHGLSYHSKHADGLAGDMALNDPRQSAAAAAFVRTKMLLAGLTPDQFKVVDEYKNPSGAATGGHIHYQFQSQAAAKLYAEYQEKQRALAKAAQPPSGVAAAAKNPAGIDTGGRRPPTGAEVAAGVPTPPPGSKAPASNGAGPGRFNPAGSGGGQGGSAAPSVQINVNGGSSDPEAVANKVHRRLSQTMNWRLHEVEHDV